MSSTTSSSLSSSNKLKEEGNKLFMKRNYKEAIEMYTKAIEKANISTYYINRGLCYFKMQNWPKTVEDCRKAIDLDSNSVKAHFYLGQALSEMNFHDEAIVNLKRSHELTKILNENYGDEITRTIRNAKRRRWNYLEEKRIKQEIELQKYLTRLMIEDKEKQLNKLKSNENKPSIFSDQHNKKNSEIQILDEKPKQTDIKTNENEIDKQINELEQDFQQKFEELNRLFNENDARRKKREIPDYLCGKISFELMHDPVITPSGITYDRYDIEQHLHRVGRFDPITRQELTIDQLIPNLSMKEVIENFISENEWIDGAL